VFWKRLRLMNLLGFPVELDVSWFVVAILLTSSLAETFASRYPGLAPVSCWAMGVLGTLGMFASILLHELGHAIVARRFGMRIRRIVLFIFGGVAEMQDEPPSAQAEFFVAIAGPIVSVVLAIAFFLGRQGADLAGWPLQAAAVAGFLSLINLSVVVFNLVPAFPLDGGRVLRSILWGLKDDLRWATRITSGIGRAFGALLIAVGIVAFISGNFLAGIWQALIGLFLYNAASMSYRQLLLRHALEGESLDRFMTEDPVVVSPETSLVELVEQYIYRHHHKMFPVVDGGRLVGCVSTRQVREVPRERWATTSVLEVAEPCTHENTIPRQADPLMALAKMNRTGASRLLVVDGDRLVGIVALKDMLGFLSARLELEPTAQAPAPPPALPRLDSAERHHAGRADWS
jgi:Zn-dependent protease/predicted transcriptional regulator